MGHAGWAGDGAGGLGLFVWVTVHETWEKQLTGLVALQVDEMFAISKLPPHDPAAWPVLRGTYALPYVLLI